MSFVKKSKLRGTINSGTLHLLFGTQVEEKQALNDILFNLNLVNHKITRHDLYPGTILEVPLSPIVFIEFAKPNKKFTQLGMMHIDIGSAKIGFFWLDTSFYRTTWWIDEPNYRQK